MQKYNKQYLRSALKCRTPSCKRTFRFHPNLYADADAGFMRLLFENLMRNAWKFTSQNKISCIEFGMENKKGQRRYFVKDNGVGFDMAQAGRLFKPYQRLHSTQEYKGTGIGLSIVKRIVEKHNGAVWAEGEKDKGAVFYFRLG